MPVSSLGTVLSNFRRTSANGRPDAILMYSTAIGCDVTEGGAVAWVMSRSIPIFLLPIEPLVRSAQQGMIELALQMFCDCRLASHQREVCFLSCATSSSVTCDCWVPKRAVT